MFTDTDTGSKAGAYRIQPKHSPPLRRHDRDRCL